MLRQHRFPPRPLDPAPPQLQSIFHHVDGHDQWKRQAVEGMAATFSGKAVSEPPVSPADVEKLHAKIGELLVERDFLRDASARLGVIRGGK